MSRLQRRHGDHDMSGMDMSGGSMMDMGDMNDGTITVTWFPQLYWIFVGCVIAVFALVNLSNHFLYWQRIRASMKKIRDPARPHNSFTSILVGVTALTREIANFSIPSINPHLRIFGWTPPTPSLGSVLLVTANAVLLIVLGFYKLSPGNANNYQNIAYRWGFLTLGQFPLVFLLAGKESILGFLTGHSYERLNWLHRWVARCMLLTATLHMGFWFGDWAPYDYIGYQIKNDHDFTQTGFAAWCVLVWIVFSSMAPIRNFCYEFFVIQHLISFTAFFAMVCIHTPVSDHPWLWVPVGLFLFDRITRAIWLMSNNLSVFHPKRNNGKSAKYAWACEAELTPLAGRMTRVTIRNPPQEWRPGQHAWLSMQSIVPLQAHPFSITSLSSDKRMEFIVKAHTGGTRRLFKYAEKQLDLPSNKGSSLNKATIPCIISNTYGSMRPLEQFDSVVLLAGSTGASFTVPLLRDIVHRWKGTKATLSSGNGSFEWPESPLGVVTRRIRFVWAVKSGEHISWFAPQLLQALLVSRELRKHGLDVRLQISIYVTCDDTFTADWNDSSSPKNKDNSSTNADIIKTYANCNGTSTTQAGDKPLSPKRDQTTAVREVDPRSDSLGPLLSNQQKPEACGPDGTCCCQTTIKDETTAPSLLCSCNCGAHINIKSPSEDPDPVRALASHINIVSGRPHPRTIVQRTLEYARGESAVVVCGPQGMNNDVRRSVVGLSDERAVGRGTGALGVWFWGEGFGW